MLAPETPPLDASGGAPAPAAPPAPRVVVAVGEPEWERRLLAGLRAAGLILAGRCLDGDGLARLSATDGDVVLAAATLHGLSPATLRAIHDAGLPLVLLTGAEHIAPDDRRTTLLPPDAPVAVICAALQAAAGRDPAQPLTRPLPDRAIAGNVKPADPSGGGAGQVIALVGGKGAPGVTTLASAVAGALGERGRAVLLVDADLRVGDIHACLDLDPRRGLGAVAIGAGNVDPAGWERRLAQETQAGPGFTVLTGIERGPVRARVGPEVVLAALGAARRGYQDVIVDAGAALPGLMPAGVEAALRHADRVLLVATPDLLGLWQARVARNVLRDDLGIPAARLALVLNRWSRRRHHPPDEVARAFGLPVQATVPLDAAAAARALAAQTPLTMAGGRQVARAVRGLAGTLIAAAAGIPEQRRRWGSARRRA